MEMLRFAQHDGLMVTFVFVLLFGSSSDGRAIELAPTKSQIDAAVQRGLQAARDRVPPNQLYTWFGSGKTLQPKGFLMTRMNGLTVMASHFGLRGEEPSDAEIERLVTEETMLVSVTIFGRTPTFAQDNYIVLKQEGKLVKPGHVRFDGVAHRTTIWPRTPRYRAKVVGSFRYGTFDANARTTILVFPSEGGEVSFDVDFSRIP